VVQVSDAELRRLERGWDAGEAEAGARLVLERLRRGLPLPAPDLEAWKAMWDHVPLEGVDPDWRGATLVTGHGGETSRAWAWLARLDDGRWLHARAWHECWSGWECLAKGRVEVTDLAGLALLLDSDDVLGLLGAPRGGGDDLLRSLELAWSVSDYRAGARLVVERLRRRRPLAPPDLEGWAAMWKHERVVRADPAWRTAVPVAGCTPAPGRTVWLARLGRGHVLLLEGNHEPGGWASGGEARGQTRKRLDLPKLLGRDVVRGLLATA
jgi:hypothetical protein